MLYFALYFMHCVYSIVVWCGMPSIFCCIVCNALYVLSVLYFKYRILCTAVFCVVYIVLYSIVCILMYFV